MLSLGILLHKGITAYFFDYISLSLPCKLHNYKTHIFENAEHMMKWVGKRECVLKFHHPRIP